MDFWSIEGECIHKYDAKEGPEALFLLIKKELSHSIESLDLSLQGVKDAMARPTFSFGILQDLQDFYQDDWKLSGCYLLDHDHSLHSLILSKEDPQGIEYRLMVNVDPESTHWRLELVNSNGVGKLFEKETHHPHEIAVVQALYESYLPKPTVKEDKPTPTAPNCFETEKDYLCKLSDLGRYVFLSHLGPSSLFRYGYERLKAFQTQGLDLQDEDLQEDLKTRPMFVKQALMDFLASKWRIESIITNKYLTVEGLLLFHVDEHRFHVFVNPYGKLLYIIDCEIESGMPVFEEDFKYREAFLLYETPKAKAKRIAYEKSLAPLPVVKPKVPEETILFSLKSEPSEKPATNADVIPDVSAILPEFQKSKILPPAPQPTIKKLSPAREDPYADWLDKFKTKRILIIGGSTLSGDAMKKACHECGFQKDNVVIYDDYEKLTNLDFSSLKGKQEKYCGIVLGPTPHKLKGLGDFASLASMLSSEGYPFTAEATRTGDARDFKITRNSLIAALGDIIRHELTMNPALI